MTDPHKHEFIWFLDKSGKISEKKILCYHCKKSLDDVIFEIQQITGAFV